MRILFLTDNFPPEVNAPANRTYEHAREWVKHGVEVTVITCAPNFPGGKVFAGYKNRLYQKEVMDGIRVVRVWTIITANKGTVKRICDYSSYAMMAFFAGLFQKSDVIIATSPQFFTALCGRWLSFFKRKPWIMEVRDLWPESIVAVGAMKRNRIIRFLEKVEMKLYKDADEIIVVTDAFKKSIAGRGIDGHKIFVNKNGVNPEVFIPQEKDALLLESLGLRDKIVFAYVGTLGMAHGLDFILKSIDSLQHTRPRFHFLFIGDGAEREHLIGLKEQLKLTNATFLPSVPKNQVVRYLSIMDVALVNLRKNDTFKTVIPSKIFEAAAMEKPILLGLQGETKEIIEQYEAGLCYEPENEVEFLEMVVKITDHNIYTRCKAGCRRLSHDFDRKKIAAQMLEDIRLVV